MTKDDDPATLHDPSPRVAGATRAQAFMYGLRDCQTQLDLLIEGEPALSPEHRRQLLAVSATLHKIAIQLSRL